MASELIAHLPSARAIRTRGKIVKYSLPREWIMCELGVFPNVLENDLLKVDRILGLTFYRAVTEVCARCIVHNSRIFA